MERQSKTADGADNMPRQKAQTMIGIVKRNALDTADPDTIQDIAERLLSVGRDLMDHLRETTGGVYPVAGERE